MAENSVRYNTDVNEFEVQSTGNIPLGGIRDGDLDTKVDLSGNQFTFFSAGSNMGTIDGLGNLTVPRFSSQDKFTIDGNQITVIAPDVGGGFGGKASLYMEELIVVAIANKLQTPVKWVSDRYEDLLTTSQGFEEIIEAELLLDKKGNFISLNSNVYGDIGAYSIYPWTAALEPMQVAGFLQGPYKVQSFYSNVKCITSNKPPTGPYRGVGRPAAVFVIELSLIHI